MRWLYIISLIAAIITFVLAVVTKLFFEKKGLLGVLPGSYLKFTDTVLLFTIFFTLLYYLPVRKE